MNRQLSKIDLYCNEHTTPHSKLLAELERETNLKTLAPQMLSGSYQGQLLTTISKLLSPTHILEIGTFTGYSAICLAAGLTDNGQLTTIEINPELTYISTKYFNNSIYKNQINFIQGDALDIIPKLDKKYDLVFIDAAKLSYNKYYDMIFPLVNKGGVILADNVLWSGKVVLESKDKDANSLNIFNKKIQNDNRVENIILPIRDGITIIRKL